jgi:hypothetical protein
MTKMSLLCAAGLLVASSSAFAAGGHGAGGSPAIGASSLAPGHEIKTDAPGSVGGPGASGYAPGRQYIDSGRTTIGGSPGASGYAPGIRSK